MRNSVKHLGGYAFEVCHDGTSAIGKYNRLLTHPPTEAPAPLAPGPAGPAISTCHLVGTVDGVSLRLKINDNPEFTAADGQFTETDAVSLFITPLPQGAAAPISVSFQNFSASMRFAHKALS